MNLGPGRPAAWLAGIASVWVAVCVGALLLLGGTDEPSRPPSSGVAPEAFSQTLARGEKACIPGQIVPAGARSLQMTIGTFGRPLRAQVSVVGLDSGRVAFRGEKTFLEAQNVDIPIRPVVRTESQIEVCITNRSSASIQLGGKPGVGLSLRYPTAERQTWLSSAGDIATRFRYARFDPFGRATMWVALALGLVSALGGAAVVIRVAR